MEIGSIGEIVQSVLSIFVLLFIRGAKAKIVAEIEAVIMDKIQPVLTNLEKQAELHQKDMEYLKEKMDQVTDSIQVAGQEDAEDVRLMKHSLDMLIEWNKDLLKRVQHLEHA